MKNTNKSSQSKPAGNSGSTNKPEIRDDLDSRTQEEQTRKGDHRTNNEKEKKEKPK